MTATTVKPTRINEPKYSITKDDWVAAENEYGACNCGPTALATMLNLPAMQVMSHLTGYKEKHYVNPTMMKQALINLSVKFHERLRRGYERVTNPDPHLLCEYGLVRIQLEGPWTQPGANPKWAYRQTHWIGSMECRDLSSVRHKLPSVFMLVFDVNSGWSTQSQWEKETIPSLVKEVPRASGGWFATHRLELEL